MAALLNLTGHFVWSLDFVAGGGHFMGWRKDAAAGVGAWPPGTKIEFFDPNDGLYSFTSHADVNLNLPPLLAGYGAISQFETWSVTE